MIFSSIIIDNKKKKKLRLIRRTDYISTKNFFPFKKKKKIAFDIKNKKAETIEDEIIKFEYLILKCEISK